MAKRDLKGMVTIYPTPVVLVSCKRPNEKANIITLAWAGVVCSKPEMVGISIQPIRHSYNIIKETNEFVVNMPKAQMVKEVDICGVKSGRDVDKFEICNFTAIKSDIVKAPLIKECPVNLECKVKKTLNLGSHFLFIAEILKKHIDIDISKENGTPIHEKMEPLAFVSPNYYAIDSNLKGFYGYSASK